jgi:iron-regulated transporter 1
MRRIDLLCKLLGPLAISSIAIASIDIAIWTTLAMNLTSIIPEYLCIAQVYKRVPALHNPNTTNPVTTSLTPDQEQSSLSRLLPLKSLPFYLHHPAFLPSLSLSLLYLTVLSLSGQMVTYLISVGYTTLHVGIIRTISTAFELSATWIAPRLMARIGVVRTGIWSLSWQMLWLAAGASWFFSSYWGEGMAATGLVVGVTLSRVGLWGYDLCAQSIVQDVRPTPNVLSRRHIN